MRPGWQELLLQSLVLLGALVAAQEEDVYTQTDFSVRGDRMFGDRCDTTSECGFDASICELGTCHCIEDYVTDHIDKCGKMAKVNESCFFDEQCEATTPSTECEGNICICRFERKAVLNPDGSFKCIDFPERGDKLFGDRCETTEECGFDSSICKQGTCHCIEDYASNHIDKCGKKAKVNESCFFDEQCEATTPSTECRGEICICRFEQKAVLNPDGSFKCIAVKEEIQSERYVDPAMIGILVAMFLMFIIICVVLRLFSRARFRENRSIFNTPNPRLMNVSLLRDSKLLHQERRGSRTSVRGPSRQPSMASLRAHSPNSQGSRRGSKGSINESATSLRSNKTPQTAPQPNSAALESVTVEIQDGKS